MIISTLIISTQDNKNSSFNPAQKKKIFLLQKMENEIIQTKTKIMSIVNDFKEKIDLNKDIITERLLEVLGNSIEERGKLANNENENDLDYLTDNVNDIKSLFDSFLSRYNIDYTPEETTTNN